jgi:hypothetical protein
MALRAITRRFAPGALFPKPPFSEILAGFRARSSAQVGAPSQYEKLSK